ncbi:HAD family hydrolase [Roseicyclus sp. F158]|uniref:HAD family hydrolase n=1 Tax=Tropicimonas omnivorans TaxID=3075590 RepID=A0ABU3DDU0_9RHOB|nr:HAD family hydrolase [Roseicyclus sp. F158]MDT0681888.1 HAD family hydrolase [Roseicyclus sp. F158]
MLPRLVIFDCDGVLVDSELLSAEVLLDVVREAGGRIEAADVYERFLGRSMASVVEILRDEHDCELTEAHLLQIRQRLFARFETDLGAIPHVAEAIARIGAPVCVASSSQPERIRLSLSLTGLLPLFEGRIYSATMVPRGKPAPDLFLHAAARMGADPAECVVIEDSVAGLRAARAAGMRTLAFTGGSHAAPARLHEKVVSLSPDAVVDDMRGLADALAALG